MKLRDQINIPNTLTVIRILIAMVAPFYLIDGSMWVRVVVGGVCVLAFATDWVDGWYARKFGQETPLGKILDPIADKVLVLIAFAVFVHLDVLSIWWIIPIFIREIAVTVYRFIFLSKNIVVAAAKSGKIKTAMQMATLAIAYALFMVNSHFREYVTDHLQYLLWIALAITLYQTISSGVAFFVDNWKIIKRYHRLA